MSDDLEAQLLDAALIHVPFDGWTEATFKAAVADCGVDSVVARGVFPRGALDLALAYHRRGDDLMAARLASADLGAMKIREKITFAVRARLEVIEDRELVRRGMTLFSLPMHAPDGARALWGTADRIWTAIGDSSDDVNWYTKRATLSGVYSSVLLYWLGDDTPGHEATWAFLDRRIEDVMRIEKAKAQIRTNALLKPLMAGPAWLASQIKPPRPAANDLPGRWRR